jgi:chromosome segregation ATPase
MDLIVMILAAMSGALIGSSTGIFLMYRKLRPLNAVELDALRSKVRTTEFDLNAAIANGVKLKQEVAGQASKVSGEAIEKQRQLDAALAAKDLEAAHRNVAEQRIAELITEADARKARQAEVEAKARQLEAKAAELEAKTAEGPSPASEEQQRQLAAFQAQVETGGRQIRELTGQATRLTAEAAELKQRSEEAGNARTALEADLMSERERLRVLTEQVSELRSELSAQDVRMQEERVSAAKGMELLVMAQQNLSRVIQAAAAEPPAANGSNGHSAAPAPAEVTELQSVPQPYESVLPLCTQSPA